MSTPPLAEPTPRKNRRLPLILIVLLLILLAALVWAAASGRLPFGNPNFHGVLMQSPDPVPDFTLTDQNGQPVSLSDFRGKLVLLYFGYTFCPDVCPTTLNELKKAQAALGKSAGDVQVIMVSVDPERDTPEKLGEYLLHFDPSFIGLTGTEEELLTAATPLGIFFSKDEGTAATGYLVNHTATVSLIDADGYLRLVYPYGTTGADIAADAKRLLP